MRINKSVKMVAYLSAGAALYCVGSQSASACGAQPFLGDICAFAFNFCPQGWAEADGQLLPISQNTALFSLLGTFYGGDGKSTFALPDLRGRVPVGMGQGPGLSNYLIGQVFGAETTKISVNQMPAHIHSFTGTNTALQVNVDASTSSGLAVAPSASNSYLGAATGATKIYTSNHAAVVPLSGVTASVAAHGKIGSAGDSQPVSIQQPSLVINYCVAMQGIFPSRN